MVVRKAELADMDEIMRCFDCARKFMRAQGNTKQWINGYPSRELVMNDMENGNFYVCEVDGKIHGAFAMIFGDDPTYQVIENGAWKNNRPYATIHRIGSDGECRGIFTAAFEYAKERIDDVRADTHEVNQNMQSVLERHGFQKCGIIYVEDGSPRVAYEWGEEKPEK